MLATTTASGLHLRLDTISGAVKQKLETRAAEHGSRLETAGHRALDFYRYSGERTTSNVSS